MLRLLLIPVSILLAAGAGPALAQRPEGRPAPEKAAPAKQAPVKQPAAPARRPAAAAPRVDPVPTGLSGFIEGFNSRTMTLDVRGIDGNVYTIDAGKAQFEARTPLGTRPAEFVDMRPGCRLEIIGTRLAGGRVLAELVRITALPLRASTEDPYPIAPLAVRTGGGAGAGAVAPPPAPERVAIRGVVRSVDRRTGIVQLRSGQDNFAVRVTGFTQFAGIDAREPDISHLRVGDVVTVEAVGQDGGLKAERVSLEQPERKAEDGRQ
jgi:hypothetical protein